MSTGTSVAVSTSTRSTWVGRVLSGLPALFLLADGVMKLVAPPEVTDAFAELGYPEHLAVAIGILCLGCLALYLYRRTALLGAVLMTGYLGGAVATQVRIEANAFSLLFPIALGTMLWAGLYLRDERLRAALTA